jgi:hypothetical protein
LRRSVGAECGPRGPAGHGSEHDLRPGLRYLRSPSPRPY